MPAGHAKAIAAGIVVAETDSYEVVEGNIYFPASSIKDEYFTKTESHTHCPWKGDASYYTINIDGNELKDAAWYYPTPFEKAENIRDHVAFYKSKVDVSTD